MVVTNLVIGFLGVGKTTFIKQLLAQKPQQEKWALLINEFGEVGVDAALLETDGGVQIKEIAGGCICCSASLPLKVSINEIIRHQNPDRIIIEPTGLGHPAGIVDVIKSDFKDLLDLKAVIGLVDVNYMGRDKVLAHATFTDQVQLADILVSTKSDIASDEMKLTYQKWVTGLFPPKQKLMSNETIDISVLDEERIQIIPTIPIKKHELSHKTMTYHKDSFGMYGVGLVFDVDKVFDANKLYELLGTITDAERVKGVFRTNEGWLSYNRTGNQTTAFYPSAYRKDSRVEVLSAYPQQKEQMKNKFEAIIN